MTNEDIKAIVQGAVAAILVITMAAVFIAKDPYKQGCKIDEGINKETRPDNRIID